MKQKLTVLACVGLALLLSTGFAFAQNTITVESKDVNRCATVQVNVTLDNLSDDVDAIGLPLLVSNGTLTGAAAGPALAGHTVAINQSGNQVLLNAVGACLASPGPHSILTLTIETSSDCSGAVTVDLDPSPLVASAGLVLTGCGCCEVPAQFNPGTLTLVNQDPICGINSDENLHFSGSIVNKQLHASDADPCDGLSYALVSGPGTVSPDGKYNWDPDCADLGTHTVTFSATDNCNGSVDCSFDVTVYHNGPVCQSVPDQTVHWADHLSAALPATDDGCPSPLSWSLIDNGGLVGALSVAGGTLNYDGNCADIPGPHTVLYQVSDGDMTCDGSVNVSVTNTDPIIACPNPVDPAHLCDHQLIDGGDGIFNLGELVEGQASGSDPDADPVSYSVISVKVDGNPYAPVNTPSIDGSGNFSWQSDGNDIVGTYEFCIEVSDGCAQATCCFSIDVEAKFYVSIKDETGTVDTIPSLPGEMKCVYINVFPNTDLGGLDLLVCYDQSTLSFLGADAINDLDIWEYFTFRYGANSNCSGSCPSGLIRIVAIADLDNGPANHPPNSAFGLEGNVVELCFQVTSDWNYLGQCLPIGFCSYDCGDNTLSSKDGNTTYLALGGDPVCLENPKPGHTAIEQIEFCGGAICVREPNDARGDINLNGVSNEISDAVLFSRYFIEGDGVFDPTWKNVQIQASDVNNDGVPLTVADLVYLIRVITGDEQPFPDDAGNPKVSPYQAQADAFVKVNKDNVTVSTNSAVDLGGALFVFRYSGMSVGEAVASDAAANMVVRSRSDRGELRVLVAPNMANMSTIQAGTREVVSIPTTGEGTIDLVEVQLADAHGALLASSMMKISPPKSYALMQNYPNPFNAGTVIRFDLKDASDWTLQVYNITGQVVRTFTGHDDASTVSVTWDGADRNGNQAASGVYFYRVNAGDYTATKKMTLLK